MDVPRPFIPKVEDTSSDDDVEDRLPRVPSLSGVPPPRAAKWFSSRTHKEARPGPGPPRWAARLGDPRHTFLAWLWCDQCGPCLVNTPRRTSLKLNFCDSPGQVSSIFDLFFFPSPTWGPNNHFWASRDKQYSFWCLRGEFLYHCSFTCLKLRFSAIFFRTICRLPAFRSV